MVTMKWCDPSAPLTGNPPLISLGPTSPNWDLCLGAVGALKEVPAWYTHRNPPCGPSQLPILFLVPGQELGPPGGTLRWARPFASMPVTGKYMRY